MNKNLIGAVLVVLFIALSIFVFKDNGDSTGSAIDGGNIGSEDLMAGGGISLSPLNSEYHVIEITSTGFSPEVVEIDQGDFVLWINRDSRRHWPATNDHPIHDAYTGFDSKAPLKTGEEWDFRFDRVGEWEYHDHLSPSKVGKIIVR